MSTEENNIVPPSQAGLVVGMYNEWLAVNVILRLHGPANFKGECATINVKFGDTWQTNKKVIHKQLLKLYNKQMGSWLCTIHKWNKLYYMLQLIAV